MIQPSCLLISLSLPSSIVSPCTCFNPFVGLGLPCVLLARLLYTFLFSNKPRCLDEMQEWANSSVSQHRCRLMNLVRKTTSDEPSPELRSHSPLQPQCMWPDRLCAVCLALSKNWDYLYHSNVECSRLYEDTSCTWNADIISHHRLTNTGWVWVSLVSSTNMKMECKISTRTVGVFIVFNSKHYYRCETKQSEKNKLHELQTAEKPFLHFG